MLQRLVHLELLAASDVVGFIVFVLFLVKGTTGLFIFRRYHGLLFGLLKYKNVPLSFGKSVGQIKLPGHTKFDLALIFARLLCD